MTLPEGLPSWLVIVLFLLFGSPALFSQFAAKLPGVFGAAGRWWQGKRQPEIRREAERAASYRVQEAEIARISAQYDRMSDAFAEQSDRLDRVEAKLAQTEDRLTETDRRFFVLVGYARELVLDFHKIAPDHPVREAPEVLREYL